MKRTITITELQSMGVESWNVKDSSPRGIHTAYTSELKPGDKVVIDDYFTTIIEPAPQQDTIMEAVAEYATIIDAISSEYDNVITVETIRKDHPELNFMDDDEITDILTHAETKRNKKEIEIMLNIYEKMTAELETRKDRSAWDKGVTLYALDLVMELEERVKYEKRNPQSRRECLEWLLNGAQDWSQYSWGGCSLIYNDNIAKRLCNPSELKKTRDGERRPNRREDWLDVQARALCQASKLVTYLYIKVVADNK